MWHVLADCDCADSVCSFPYFSEKTSHNIHASVQSFLCAKGQSLGTIVVERTTNEMTTKTQYNNTECSHAHCWNVQNPRNTTTTFGFTEDDTSAQNELQTILCVDDETMTLFRDNVLDTIQIRCLGHKCRYYFEAACKCPTDKQTYFALGVHSVFNEAAIQAISNLLRGCLDLYVDQPHTWMDDSKLDATLEKIALIISKQICTSATRASSFRPQMSSSGM